MKQLAMVKGEARKHQKEEGEAGEASSKPRTLNRTNEENY